MAKKLDLTTLVFGGVIGAVIIGIVLLLVVQPTGQVAIKPPAFSGAIAGECGVEDVALKYSIYDSIAKSTQPDINAIPTVSLADGTIAKRSRINNIDSGGGTTVAVGAGIVNELFEDIVAGTSATDYYYTVISGTVGCQDPYEIAGNVPREGELTLTLSDKTGFAANSPANPEALGNGGSTTLQLRMDSNADNGWFGNPICTSGQTWIFDFNGDVLNKVEPANVDWKIGSMPGDYSTIRSRQRVYTVDLTSLGNEYSSSMKEHVILTPSIYIEAQAGDSPKCTTSGACTNGSVDDVNMTIKDCTFFEDTETGTFIEGFYDDDDLKDIGATDAKINISLS